MLQRWAALLQPQGRLILIEGCWGTGVGLPAKELLAFLPASFTNPVIQNLSDNSNLWGKVVSDERYAIITDKST
jgi:hypothetical protein